MGNIIRLNIDNQRLTELTKNDGTKSIVLMIEAGYEPIIKYRDILVNGYNFQIESEYGITDMTYIFNYQNNKYILHYNSNEDMITFETKANNDAELNIYRKLAAYLHSVDVKKNEQINIRK